MADSFPQSLAFLLAFWINALLHGIYLMLFLRWFFNKRDSSIYFVIVCWFGFVASNIDIIVNLYLLVEGFWFWLPKGGPNAFFSNLANWPTVLREVNYQILVSVCDAFMVYRLWKVWDGNWYIAILPSILLLCETIFGLMAPFCLALKNFELLPLAINVFLGFNTALQVVLTVLIAFRLLDPRKVKYLPASQRALRFQLVRCVVESGMIVTVALIIDLALFAPGILFHWIFNISLTQLYAITTVLIVLRMNSFTNPPSDQYSSHPAISQVASHVEYPRTPRTGGQPGGVITFNQPNGLPKNKTKDLPSVLPGDRFSSSETSIEMKHYKADAPAGRAINVNIVREVYNQV